MQALELEEGQREPEEVQARSETGWPSWLRAREKAG